MKKIIPFLIFVMLLSGCGKAETPPDIAATTLPVYDFTQALCQDTPLRVGRLITESVSCLHDYSLNVNQVRQAESAQTVVLSGAGLEDFMADILEGKPTVDASRGISLLEGEEHEEHDHHEEHHAHDGHDHEWDPHIWLSPENAKIMARNICLGLTEQYPQWETVFSRNLEDLLARLDALEQYGQTQLRDLSCRELITFHDGFAYFAQAFDLEILAAVEEESGSEASAKEL
ncbi:MAG: metal ABC transporter substrate-binding protein, partial [Candidatus Faecousia sp.]|nr:metal ABC transporter substrate-binding protein [Candidatus Faecousia sp.]